MRPLTLSWLSPWRVNKMGRGVMCVFTYKDKKKFFWWLQDFQKKKEKKEINKIKSMSSFLTQILKQTTTQGNFSSFYSVVNSVFCCTMQWNLLMDEKCTRKKTMRPGRYPLILFTCQRFVLVWELIKLVEVSYCKRYGNPNPVNQTMQ